MPTHQKTPTTDISNIDRAIGSRIRLLRVRRHMTQKDLATAVGFTQQQISHYEAGARSIEAARLYLLRSRLNISIADFFVDLD